MLVQKVHKHMDNSNNSSNSNEWIMLIDDDYTETVYIDSSNNSSEKSFASDDILALKILGDNYDCEAQKPLIVAYAQVDNNDCCYGIKKKTKNRDLIGWTVVIMTWQLLIILFYILLHT